MLKFEGYGSELAALNISTIQPAALSSELILRLEARGVPKAVFQAHQARYLQKIGGALTRRRALRLIRADFVQRGACSYLGTLPRWSLQAFILINSN